MLAPRPYLGAIEARLPFLFFVHSWRQARNGRPQSPAHWSRSLAKAAGPPPFVGDQFHSRNTDTRKRALSPSRLRWLEHNLWP